MEIVLDDLRTGIAAQVNSDLAVVRWREAQAPVLVGFCKSGLGDEAGFAAGRMLSPRFSFSVSAVLMTLMFRLLSRPGALMRFLSRGHQPMKDV